MIFVISWFFLSLDKTLIGAQLQRQNQLFTRQYVLILINEILKNKNIDSEAEESDADIDIRISLRNEFIRDGLTDKRILKIRADAQDEKQVRNFKKINLNISWSFWPISNSKSLLESVRHKLSFETSIASI